MIQARFQASKRHYIRNYLYNLVPVRVRRRFNKLRFDLTRRNIFLTKNEKKLKALKNIHKGQRCFIIGNGPSLRIEDLEKLNNEITLAANKIYLAFESTKWRPTYYCVTDDMVVKQNFDDINNLSGFVKFFPSVSLTRWKTFLDNAVFFRYTYYKKRFPEPPKFGFDITDRIYAGRTVLYALIQIAAFMGIRKIYMTGVDFDFTMPSQKKGRLLISKTENNHFHPEYRRQGEIWVDPKLDHQEAAFKAAKTALNQLGGQIYNATRGGKLEVFPRVDFDKLFRCY